MKDGTQEEEEEFGRWAISFNNRENEMVKFNVFAAEDSAETVENWRGSSQVVKVEEVDLKAGISMRRCLFFCGEIYSKWTRSFFE